MNLLLQVLRFLLALLFMLFRLLLPFLLAALRLLRDVISISFIATVNDPPQFIDRLAADWTRRLLELGAPPDHIDQIYSFCQLLAGTTIVLGWIVSIFFTVEILRIVFGIFI